MLEIFKVPADLAVKVQESALRDTVVRVFRKMDVPEEDCQRGADVLVKADMRGVETHGVSNMLRSYVNGYTDGSINPRPNWRIIRETPATANIDSDRGLGIIITPKAMEIAIEKAKQVGVGMVTIRNGRHLGMASYHAMMALEHDMIGVCMTSCPPSVLPTFGAQPRLGTNPIALAAPADEEPPFVFDAATSTVAATNIKELPIPVPPADEQRTIADYLDREIARLDELVAAKKRVLGLAVEKRRALITRAVTRGLDPRTPLRDPGIPWLGEIPAHWELIPLRFLVDIVGGATPDTGKAEFWNGDIPWVSPKDMKRNEIKDTEDHISALAHSVEPREWCEHEEW